MKALLSLCAITVLLASSGCGRSDPNTSQSQSSTANITSSLTGLDWSTTGGGQISFTITPSPLGVMYVIQVSSYNFAAKNTTINLSAAAGPVFNFVDGLFQGGTQAIAGTACSGACGTSTSITIHLASGLSKTISSPTVAGNPSSNPFDAVYSYVTSQI